VFTSRFQVFPFLEMIRRCDQRAVQQVIVTVRLITVSATAWHRSSSQTSTVSDQLIR